MPFLTVNALALWLHTFCTTQIDPRYDYEVCMDYMYKCIVLEQKEILTCSDFYDN